MRIAILSKPGAIENWAEDAEQDFRLAGHEVTFIATRHRHISPFVNDLVYGPRLGKIRASFIVSALRKFAPDLILAIAAYQIPPVVLEAVSAMPSRAPFVGWVGVKFSDAQAKLAPLFDLVAYADTGLVRAHEAQGLASPCLFLPLATRAPEDASRRTALPRSPRMLFIGNPNPHRRDVLNKIAAEVEIYGPRWNRAPMAPHHRLHPKRISPASVRDLYRAHSLTLNMKSEAYNIDGLNQRHFAPYPFGCAVAAERMNDIEQAFDGEREMFLWSTTDDLNALMDELIGNPARVAAVAEAGARRVLGEHLYRHRLASVMARLK